MRRSVRIIRAAFLLFFLICIAAGCVARSAALFNDRGLVQFDRGNYERAYESFSEAASLMPDWAEVYYNRARAAIKLSRPKDAEADLSRAIELSPGYAAALNARGDLMFSRNRYEAARADFSRVIALSPAEPELFCKRGLALERLDRPDEAEADLDRAVGLAPADTACLIERGRFYFRAERFGSALADLTTAATLAPGSPDPYLYRGMVYEYGLLRPEAALEDYDRAVKNAPRDPHFRNCRANLLIKLGRVKEALADFSVICRMGYSFGCWQYEWLTDEKE